jgi:hypothetical protein
MALEREMQVFISTMLYRSVFEDTIKVIKPTGAKDFFGGGESNHGSISVYSTIESSIRN